MWRVGWGQGDRSREAEDQIDAAKVFGASDVVQVGAVDEVVAAVRALTPEGRGADVVIEACGKSGNVGVGG